MEAISKYLETIDLLGYCIIPKGGETFLNELHKELGEIIQQKDIVIEENPKKWATSPKRMPLHSDHPKANFIAWHCIEQTDKGGESLLSDISIAIEKLTESQKETLKIVQLKNIQLFEGDLELHPIVTEQNNIPEYYFVPWLVRESESEATKNVMKDLENKLQEQVISFLLKKGDVLIINNKRILHGRNEIFGSTNRFLKRYWIKSNK